MPAAQDLFAPASADTLVRSLSGLAFSDRELKQMREWIQAGDERLFAVIAALGECLQAASAAMKSVRPAQRDSMRGPFPDEAVRRHAEALTAVAQAAERAASVAKFEKVPFFKRHFIHSGDMPNGLSPRDFDAPRNDEAVYEKRRAEAMEGAAARQKEREPICEASLRSAHLRAPRRPSTPPAAGKRG